MKSWKSHSLSEEWRGRKKSPLKGKKPRNGSMVVEDYLRPAAVKAGVITVDEAGRWFDAHDTEIKRFGFHTSVIRSLRS